MEAFEVKAAFKLSHHVDDEQMLATGIAAGIEDAGEVASLQNAPVFGNQLVVVEDAIHAVCHPLRIEDVGIF